MSETEIERMDDYDVYISEVDDAILEEIESHGRATTGLLADILGKSQPYISQRVTRMCEHGILIEVSSGLYDKEEQAAEYLPPSELGDE